MIHNTRLSFLVLDTHSNKTMAIVDTSYYNTTAITTGSVLQIILPDRPGAIELPFNANGVTILNSNNLGITNVLDENFFTDLPDGAYTAKISICPYDQFWYENTWYRTGKLQCKYYNAILKLDLSECQSCFSPEKDNEIWTAKRFIEGIHANMEQGNIRKATQLYNVANYILDDILNCNCSGANKTRGWGQGKRNNTNWKGWQGSSEYGFAISSPTGYCCGEGV